jgi:hypothetical protein
MMVGAIYDNSDKGYTPGFLVLIAIALAGAVIVSFLPKKVGKYGVAFSEKN